MICFGIVFALLFWGCPFTIHGAPTQGPKGVCLCANHLQLMLSLHEINQLQAVCAGNACPSGGGHLKEEDFESEFAKFANELSNHNYGSRFGTSQDTEVGVQTPEARLFSKIPADGSSDTGNDVPVTPETESLATGRSNINRTPTGSGMLWREEQRSTNLMTDVREGFRTVLPTTSDGQEDDLTTISTSLDGPEHPSTTRQLDTFMDGLTENDSITHKTIFSRGEEHTRKESQNALEDAKLVTSTTTMATEDPQITVNTPTNGTTSTRTNRTEDAQDTHDISPNSTDKLFTTPTTSSNWIDDPKATLSSPPNWTGNSQTTLPVTPDMIEEIISTIPPIHLEYSPHDTSQDLQTRSLCPWRYVANVDPDRYPQTLIEAECLSEECCCGLEQSSGVGCERIYRAVAVLRRVKQDNCDKKDSFAFERREERLAVGCTCSLSPTEK